MIEPFKRCLGMQ